MICHLHKIYDIHNYKSKRIFKAYYTGMLSTWDKWVWSVLQVNVGGRQLDASEVERLIPQLEETIERKDKQIKEQKMTLDTHMKRISELEGEVKALQVVLVRN